MEMVTVFTVPHCRLFLPVTATFEYAPSSSFSFKIFFTVRVCQLHRGGNSWRSWVVVVRRGRQWKSKWSPLSWQLQNAHKFFLLLWQPHWHTINFEHEGKMLKSCDPCQVVDYDIMSCMELTMFCAHASNSFRILIKQECRSYQVRFLVLVLWHKHNRGKM